MEIFKIFNEFKDKISKVFENVNKEKSIKRKL